MFGDFALSSHLISPFLFQIQVSTHSTHVLLLFGCVEMGANNNNTQLYICTHTACCVWDVDVFLLRLCCLGIVCSHILICCHLFVLGVCVWFGSWTVGMEIVTHDLNI